MRLRPHFRWNLHTRSLPLGERTCWWASSTLLPILFPTAANSSPQPAPSNTRCACSMKVRTFSILAANRRRPGTHPQVSAQEELDRVLPVIEAMLQANGPAPSSRLIPTRPKLRAPLFTAGAEIVNDVSGFLWDPAMAATCAELRCGVILMHTRGRSSEWRAQPPLPHDEVVPLVLRELEERSHAALAAGVEPAAIVLDPGFGFGKCLDENYPLLAHFEELHTLGYPLLAGPSRKGFLGRTLAANVRPRGIRPINAATPPSPPSPLQYSPEHTWFAFTMFKPRAKPSPSPTPFGPCLHPIPSRRGSMQDETHVDPSGISSTLCISHALSSRAVEVFLLPTPRRRPVFDSSACPGSTGGFPFGPREIGR